MNKRRLIVQHRKLRAREPPVENQSRLDPQPPSVIVVQGNESSVSRKPQRRGSLGARTKLNWAAVNGAILVAALVAGVTHSLWAGGVILVLLIVEAIATGQIRLSRRQ